MLHKLTTILPATRSATISAMTTSAHPMVASQSELLAPSSAQAIIPRRHDLDALRAIAMLLGIALHAALSYIPMPQGGWAIHDVRQSSSMAVFITLIHGFRMPLFFLISGFFTAMLWRKRGLRSVLWQRFKRIFLPLVIGVFTIIPILWVAIIGAAMYQSSLDRGTNEENLWSAARSGNLEMIQSGIAAGASLNQCDADYGATPLAMASGNGNAEVVEALIAAGADVNARNRDGATPLHGAAFLGRDQVFELLMKHGADLEARDRGGNTPRDLLVTSWGRTMIVAGFFGVTVDQESLFAGRKAIASSLQAATDRSTDSSAIAATSDAEISMIDRQQRTAGASMVFMLLAVMPFFHHLWFLWFLCWLVAAFAIYALILKRFSWTMPKWMVISPLRYAWLIPLTLIPQSMMGLVGPSFGPDTSTGLLPLPQILGYYAIFFFFGAVYFDSDDREAKLGRRWYLTLPLALGLVFPLGYEMTTGAWGFSDRWVDSPLYHPLSMLLQVSYVWLMSFGLMGVFRHVFSAESRAMRYVSDSSYWLYLAHLPLILIVQAAILTWEIPVFAKFAIVCTVTTAFLLASYQLCVRYTPIGTLLNGPRYRPEKVVDAVLAAPAGATD